MNTKEIVDRIFKNPGIKYDLTEFENLGKPIHDILSIYLKSRVEQLIEEAVQS